MNILDLCENNKNFDTCLLCGKQECQPFLNQLDEPVWQCIGCGLERGSMRNQGHIMSVENEMIFIDGLAKSEHLSGWDKLYLERLKNLKKRTRADWIQIGDMYLKIGALARAEAGEEDKKQKRHSE